MFLEKVVLKYDGRVHEISASSLDFNPEVATDRDICTAVERHLDLGDGSLDDFVVYPDAGHPQRYSVAVWNLRPSAEFGS